MCGLASQPLLYLPAIILSGSAWPAGGSGDLITFTGAATLPL
jgi:hypothetical protein